MKPTRPYRLVTAGNDDSRLLFHKGGPPFVAESSPDERVHVKGKAIHAVRYSPNGQYIASVSADRCLNIFDGTTLTLLCQRTGAHQATIYDVAWHPAAASDNNNNDTFLSLLITASGDGTCKVWQVEKKDNAHTLQEYRMYRVADHQNRGQPAFTKVPPGAAQVGCDFVGPDRAIAVSLNGQLSILHLTEDTIQTITGHSAPIADCCCYYPSDHNNKTTGFFFYTCDSEGVVVQWDAKSGQPIKRLVPNGGDVDLFHKVHKGAAVAVAVLQDNLLFSVGYDDQLRITKDNVVQETATPLGSQPVAMAAGTNRAVVATVQSLLLIDATGSILDTKKLPYEALSVTVTKDDTKAYVGGKDNIIHVYDIDSSGSLTESTMPITGHRKPVHALALSKDGTKLASGDDKDICVWDLTTNNNEPLVGPGKWCFHTQRITKLAWSPDGRILASAGADDAIFLWCLESKMKRIHYKFCHRGGITGLHFLADRRLVSAGVDAAVQVWNVASDVTAKFG
jgi:WD repeat-containing protein 1 (actin-interacting protein 1)